MAEAISDWIAERVADAGAAGVVIGLSGGIDSTVTAALAGQAGFVKGICMPCGSHPRDAHDAEASMQFCGEILTKLDLTSLHGVFAHILGYHTDSDISDDDRILPFANLKARMRMAVLYYFANMENLLVCGTTNKSELLTGYFTKYGDGGVDIEPLADVWKTDVYRLAKYLDLPQDIIDRPPTAGLWEGQTDEAELGMSYEQLDFYLSVIHNAVQQGETLEPGLVVDENQERFDRVIKLYRNSQHKRELPPCCLLVEDE